MATVMGIDPSLTSTGWVVLKKGELVSHGAIQSKQDGIERIVEIENKLNEIIRHYHPDLVYLEGYSFGSKGKSVIQIGELGGQIRLMLWSNKKNIGTPDWKEIPPTVVKKFCTGKGTAKKEDMKLYVYKKWGVEFKTNDECDAYALAKMAEKEMEFKEGMA